MDWLSHEINLPGETMPGQCILELAGDRRILVENHWGICQYSTHRIGVKVSYGQLHICGDNLEIIRMTGKQLVITGCIDGIEILRRERK